MANGVTVYLYAANIQFSPNNVSFSGTKLSEGKYFGRFKSEKKWWIIKIIIIVPEESVTGQQVTVTPTNIGPDKISFLVKGPDAAYYNTPGTIVSFYYLFVYFVVFRLCLFGVEEHEENNGIGYFCKRYFVDFIQGLSVQPGSFISPNNWCIPLNPPFLSVLSIIS